MSKLRLYQISDQSFYIEGTEYKLVAKGEINRPAKIKNVETDEVIDYGFAEWVDLENQLKILEDEIKEIPEEEQWFNKSSEDIEIVEEEKEEEDKFIMPNPEDLEIIENIPQKETRRKNDIS